MPAALATLVSAPGAAHEPAGEPRAEDIVVTGSRLKTDARSLQPIATVTSEDITRSGAITAADVLNEMPQFGSAFGATSQDFNAVNRGFTPAPS